MERIYFFSPCGHSKAVAEFLKSKLDAETYDILHISDENMTADTAVVVFPVYCQNIPEKVTKFLLKLKAHFVAAVAVYGGISYGNVIWETQRLVGYKLIGAACVPSGHTYLRESGNVELSKLEVFIERVRKPQIIRIAREKKNIFADFFPEWRSRIGVKIKKSGRCNNCGKCIKECTSGAMTDEGITGRCIRCLHCVNVCPQKALDFSLNPLLVLYLKQKRKNEWKLYL
ncbi:MAG: 4Fe-4S dicluster domain-containing protein [Ruminococcaceae bacterium]|nr:4Fe-4S dicluster domain-containing protein [Oscillospiraceae bacterium]